MNRKHQGEGTPAPHLPRRERRRQAAESRRSGRVDAVRFELRHMDRGCRRLHLISILADGTEVHTCLHPDNARRVAVELLSRLPLEGAA